MFKKNKKSLGLVITDKYIRVLELEIIKGEKIVGASNEVNLDGSIVEGGLIKNPKELAKKLNEVLKSAKPRAITGREINFALPDELVYTHIFQVELRPGKGIKQAVQREYEQYIPLAKDSGEYSFKVIDEKLDASKKNSLNVILVAAAKKSLLSWQNFFEQEKFKIDFFDIGSLSKNRGVFLKEQNSYNNLEEKYLIALGLAARTTTHDFEQSDPILPCIGHAYSLEVVQVDTRLGLKILLFIAKYLLIPMVFLILLATAWFNLGLKSSSDKQKIIAPKTEMPVIVATSSKSEIPKNNNSLPTKEESLKKNLLIIESDVPLNVRKGPGTNFESWGKINNGSEQVLLEEKGDWYRIDWNGEKSAWIKAEYAKKVIK